MASYSYSSNPNTPLKFGADENYSGALLQSPISTTMNPSMSPSISRSGSGFLPSHLFPISTANVTPNPQKQIRKEEVVVNSNTSGMLPTWDQQSTSRDQRFFNASPYTTKQSPVDIKKSEYGGNTVSSVDRDSLPPSESLYDSTPMNYYAEHVSEAPISSTSMVSATTSNGETQQDVSQFGEMESMRETIDERWVTVFGFTPVSSSIVTKTFQKYGDIIRCEMGKGNFMHLLYRTRLQAQKALSKNGKKIDEGLIIGVVSRDSVEREINAKLPRQVQAADAATLHAPQVTVTPFSSSSKSSSLYASTPVVSSSDSWWKKVQEYVLGW